MNKKADIPTTILVIGIFSICVFALLSFSISNSMAKKSFTGSGLIEEAVSVSEQYNFYKENTDFSEEEIIAILNEKDFSIYETEGADITNIVDLIQEKKGELKIEKDSGGTFVRIDITQSGDKIFSVKYYLD